MLAAVVAAVNGRAATMAVAARKSRPMSSSRISNEAPLAMASTPSASAVVNVTPS